MPDCGLDRRRLEMVRGWVPAVEAALGDSGWSRPRGAAGAALCERLPRRLSRASAPEEAARDILRLRRRWTTPRTAARPAVRAEPTAGRRGSRLYRLGGAIALSDAVPVLENFGFRVIEEVPTALAGGKRLRSTISAVEAGGAADSDAIIARSASEGAIAGCWKAGPRTTRSTG